MKTKLHELAIRNGWYRLITKELPLNVCKTVFGGYCFEGYFTPQSLPSIIEDVYQWGLDDVLKHEVSIHEIHRDLIMKQIKENLENARL